MSTLQVGQVLWLVPRNNGHGQPRETTVLSVGRKWAKIDAWGRRDCRIDLETLAIDGGDYSSPGRCYVSRDEHESSARLANLWREFARRVPQVSRPGCATEANIRLAADLLGIQLPG